MKRIITLTLTVLIIISGVFALTACSNKSGGSGNEITTAAEATTEAALKEAKISKHEVYVTFDTADYNYDEELTEIISRDGSSYLYAKGLNESELEARRDSFDALQDNDKLTNVYYSEMQAGEHTAKTAVYTDGKGFYKRYFIELAAPANDLYGIEIQASLGADKMPEADFDEMVSTLTIK